jgi:hypothetical protein
VVKSAAWRALPVLLVFALACGRSALREELAAGSSSGPALGGGSGCPEPASALPDAGGLELSTGPYSTSQVTLHNHCSETIWPAMGRTGLDQTIADPSLRTPISPGASSSATLHYVVVLEVKFWGRTRCAFDEQGKGACETGDCGGFVCPIFDNDYPHDATVFALGVGYLEGFNVPMRVAVSGCEPVECGFDLDTCPAASRSVGACGSVVACTSMCPSSCCPSSNGCSPGGDVDITFCP